MKWRQGSGRMPKALMKSMYGDNTSSPHERKDVSSVKSKLDPYRCRYVHTCIISRTFLPTEQAKANMPFNNFNVLELMG